MIVPIEKNSDEYLAGLYSRYSGIELCNQFIDLSETAKSYSDLVIVNNYIDKFIPRPDIEEPLTSAQWDLCAVYMIDKIVRAGYVNANVTKLEDFVYRFSFE